MRWLCFVQIHICRSVESSVAAILNAEVSRWSFLLKLFDVFWKLPSIRQKVWSKKFHRETSAFNTAATELFTKQLWIWTKQSHPMSSAMKKSLLWKMLTLHFYNTTYNWWLSWHRRHKTACVSLPLVCIRCREIAIFESWLNLLVNLKLKNVTKWAFLTLS